MSTNRIEVDTLDIIGAMRTLNTLSEVLQHIYKSIEDKTVVLNEEQTWLLNNLKLECESHKQEIKKYIFDVEESL